MRYQMSLDLRVAFLTVDRCVLPRKPNTMSQKKRKYRVFVILAMALVLVVVGIVARPATHIIRAIKKDADALQPLPPGYVDDASRLNATKVADVWQIPVDSDDPEQQLAALLQQAREDGRKVSIAGARHSMGGHTMYPGGLVIDMTSWKQMELDAERDILKVQAGAMWNDIIAYLDQRGKSVAIMQSNNSFSVGGAISVNCHGWQYDRPPIASTVESFRLMKADGSIVRCSRTENRELFSLALGGYGLFGVILDVELRVVPNERYRLEQTVVPFYQSLATFNHKVKNRSDIQMVYARMAITPDRLFKEVIINAFVPDQGGEIPELTNPGMIKLRRAVFRGSADSDYGKELRWSAETIVQPKLRGVVFSRNQLLNEEVEVFQNRSVDTTDILHEYFVPLHRVADFAEVMREIVKQHSPNLLNVTVRSVNADEDTFLRYADEQMISFVMLYVQDKTDKGERKMKALTHDLIDAALEHDGRYYLPYRLHATPEQFHKAYPQAREFFELKRKHDPDELFQNQFYLKYGKVEE